MTEPARHARRPRRRSFLDHGPLWLWPTVLGLVAGGLTAALYAVIVLITLT